MTYPEVQFVAAPEDGAEVLFDFNEDFSDAPAAIVAGSFTLGAPSLEGDPDGLGVQYGPREVGFSLFIYGNRYAAMQTQALLARTFMLRRRGWLRVRLDDYSAPVWLRTYTPTPSELDFALIQPDPDQVDAWQLEVTVAAEPFIRGERIELWSGTINNDPEHATNPMGVNLPEVIGDAAAPLRITAEFSRAHDQSDVLLATSAVPTEHEPIVWDIGTDDGWGIGFDVGAPEADAAFVGGSFRRINFATIDEMTVRLAGDAPSAVAPGRYRVMIRVAAVGGTYNLRLGYRTEYDEEQFAGSGVSQFTSAAPFYAAWVDLGDFDFPRHRSSADFPEVAGLPRITLHAERVSGASDLVLDAFKLVPIDVASVTTLEPWEKADVLVSEFVTRGPQALAGEVQVWDGDSEMSFRVTPAGVVDAVVAAANRGHFPSVRPGVTNRLTFIQQTRPGLGGYGTSNNSDLITDSADISVSYQPRLLWLGDA